MMSIPTKQYRAVAILAGLIAGVAILASATIAKAQDEYPGLDAVLDELRAGGFVIYLRHATTDEGGPTDEDADLERCETQRNLNDLGREQAAQIGKAIAALGVPIGEVVSSPFCRCKETAELAFGRFAIDADVSYIITAHPDDTKRMTDSLRRMLSTAPAQGTNTVIVSHTGNLREAADIWPKPEGVAFVFRPLPEGKFEAVAKVLAEDWAKAAGLP